MSNTFDNAFHALITRRAIDDSFERIKNEPRYLKRVNKAMALQKEILELVPEHRGRLDDLDFEMSAAQAVVQEFAYTQGLSDGLHLAKMVSELLDKAENIAVLSSFFHQNEKTKDQQSPQ